MRVEKSIFLLLLFVLFSTMRFFSYLQFRITGSSVAKQANKQKQDNLRIPRIVGIGLSEAFIGLCE